MDLDFSFALVSSLTPRSLPTRTPLIENNKLSSRSKKVKVIKSISSQSQQKAIKSSLQKEEDNKENHPFEEQLMNKNESCKSDIIPYVENSLVSKDSSDYPVDMTNITTRTKKCNRDRRKKNSSLNYTKNEIVSHGTELTNGLSQSDYQESDQRNTNHYLDVKETSLESDAKNTCNETHTFKKCVKRKSARQNKMSKTSVISGDSLNLIESPCLGLEYIPSDTNNRLSINSNLNKTYPKSPLRTSDIVETSLSTAYDSGSIRTTRRQAAKVIPETPESDESLKNISSRKKKCSFDSELSSSGKGKSSLRLSETSISSSYISSSLKTDSLNDKKSIKSCNIADRDGEVKEPGSGKCSFTDSFKFKTSLKAMPNVDKKKEIRNTEVSRKNDSLEYIKKLSISPVLKEINIKTVLAKKPVPVKGKQLKHDLVIRENEDRVRRKTTKKGTKKSKERNSDKSSTYAQETIDSIKSSVAPPSEIIPKFEHVNNWLKDTQENSLILISSDSSFNSPDKVPKPTKQKPTNTQKSLSPRIKRKLKVAQTTLQEEQQIFEELYGSDLVKRLSDDVEENPALECSQESLEISEKVLETIYGTVWQKDEVLPQSEPRKGRPKNLSKKKAPHTERKKHRTSIYEVFSSSSSEDRFEEFLENVHRGKLKSTLRIGNRPSTPDFINDSESGCETSFTFYQNVLSSEVKEEIVRRSPKVNRRRLSFASSQEECSESGKSDLKPKGRENKNSTKDKKKDNSKPRSKKKLEALEKHSTDDVIGFTLVTPIKVKDKKTGNDLDVRIKHLIENELPKSVGKSKTPKSNVKKDHNTEERLREKYLNEGNFKVPKHLKSLKTPNKLTRIGTPSSPALSFLSSLSEITAGLPCHPDALIYKKKFKDKREELTKKLYSLYNREVFDNQLPGDMVIEWSTRMRSTSGFCYNKRMYSNNQIFRSSRIVLSTKILDRADRLRDTLIHELCHAATWIVNATSDGHGPKWKAWADKANRRFPELPVIKRCHDYAISTKFTYKCMSCGYCIGRHSKSLNTDRKRCGYCYGKFEVFVTAKMSTASVTSGSDSVKTQQTPTGFALFVKENYASVKKENNVPHGQVMKLLSQKFAEVKISKQKEKEPVINL